MTDLALQQLPDGSLDLCLFDGALVRDESIRAAVFVSLLSDREWPDAPAGERRGWWADALNANPNDRIGSGLWRLQRRKHEPSTLIDARQYAEQALAWMVDDQIARGVAVVAVWDARGFLQLDIQIERASGALRFRLAQLWQQSLAPSAPDTLSALVSQASATDAQLEFIYYAQFPEIFV